MFTLGQSGAVSEIELSYAPLMYEFNWLYDNGNAKLLIVKLKDLVLRTTYMPKLYILNMHEKIQH